MKPRRRRPARRQRRTRLTLLAFAVSLLTTTGAFLALFDLPAPRPGDAPVATAPAPQPPATDQQSSTGAELQSLASPPASPTLPPAAAAPSAQIAIIIDDLGHNFTQGRVAVHLPGAVTLALMPFAPHSRRLAELAAANDKEVMLHAPMQPITHRAWQSGLDTGMNERQLRGALRNMLDALPQAVGVNNHMGSSLTQDAMRMGWVMQTLAERNLYFVDSRTSAATQALVMAQKLAVPSVERDVFLDNNRDEAMIAAQLRKLVNIAHNRGFAVGIGHPYPETLTTLSKFLEKLSDTDTALVPASQIIARGSPYYAERIQQLKEESVSIKQPVSDSKSI